MQIFITQYSYFVTAKGLWIRADSNVLATNSSTISADFGVPIDVFEASPKTKTTAQSASAALALFGMAFNAEARTLDCQV